MNNVQHLIQDTFTLSQEPVHVNIKYDGETFRVEIPANADASTVSCGPPQYFDLEKAICSCLLHYMKLKTELKHIKEGALCQDA
jgi:hypothetical protein